MSLLSSIEVHCAVRKERGGTWQQVGCFLYILTVMMPLNYLSHPRSSRLSCGRIVLDELDVSNHRGLHYFTSGNLHSVHYGGFVFVCIILVKLHD